MSLRKGEPGPGEDAAAPPPTKVRKREDDAGPDGPSASTGTHRGGGEHNPAEPRGRNGEDAEVRPNAVVTAGKSCGDAGNPMPPPSVPPNNRKRPYRRRAVEVADRAPVRKGIQTPCERPSPDETITPPGPFRFHSLGLGQQQAPVVHTVDLSRPILVDPKTFTVMDAKPITLSKVPFPLGLTMMDSPPAPAPAPAKVTTRGINLTMPPSEAGN